MGAPSTWDWSGSADNLKAYLALVNKGSTRNFTKDVWNDIVTKISEQHKNWFEDTYWDEKILSLENTKMTDQDHRMTADRFNSAVNNVVNFKSWQWEKELERKLIQHGDVCYGIYFIYLVDQLNKWIGLIPLPIYISKSYLSDSQIDVSLLSTMQVVIYDALQEFGEANLNVLPPMPFNIDSLLTELSTSANFTAGENLSFTINANGTSDGIANIICYNFIPFAIVSGEESSTTANVSSGIPEYLKGDISIMGASAVSAELGANIARITGSMMGELTDSVNVQLYHVEHIKSEISSELIINKAILSLIRYILSSELDNVLVTDLNNVSVADTEIEIIN